MFMTQWLIFEACMWVLLIVVVNKVYPSPKGADEEHNEPAR